jgi:hypothetical protein
LCGSFCVFLRQKGYFVKIAPPAVQAKPSSNILFFQWQKGGDRERESWRRVFTWQRRLLEVCLPKVWDLHAYGTLQPSEGSPCETQNRVFSLVRQKN